MTSETKDISKLKDKVKAIVIQKSDILVIIQMDFVTIVYC